MTQIEQRADGDTAQTQEGPIGRARPPVREHIARPQRVSSLPKAVVTMTPNPLSYAWLGLALVLLIFGTARWSIPLAAWLYPVFLRGSFAHSRPSVASHLCW